MVTYSPFSYQTVGIQTQYISPIKSVGYQAVDKREKEEFY